MKKIQILLIASLGFVASLSAQYQNATEEQKKDIVSKITQASDAMNTMQCDFTQVKELSFMDDKMTSEGKMSYKKTNKIRWEYRKPYQYVFSMDGQKIQITSGDKTNTISAKQSKLFGEISKVMVGGVNGSGLVNSPDFDTKFQVGSDVYLITLTPKIKELKDMFSMVQLYVSKSDFRIRSVELVEKSGDKTTISLKNIQTNIALNDELFSQ